jgi:glycosyltransferase involved in cell wall biosynthesis
LKYVGETAKTVASMPVDGKNCRGTWINGLDLGIFWTQFGLDEARAGGFAKPASVVPLGIDLNLYQPMNRVAARRAIGLPPELDKAFIVGNVNRNQPRKRLDLTVKYFAKWVEESGATDAYLYLHVAPTGDVGYDVQQLMQYYGFKGKNKRLIFVEPKIGPGVPEAMLTQVYSSFDVQVTTTQGEGWGLPTMEGMACGVPQIVPVWAALGEWCEDAVVRIHCDSTIVTPNGINAVGGVPMERTFISALDLFYQDRTFGEKYAKRGLDLVRQPRFRWSEIGLRYAEVLAALGTEEVAAAAVSA